jgi:hypothetical protein
MKKLNYKGFVAIEAVLVVVIVAIMAGTGFYVYNANNKTSDTLDSADKSANSAPGTANAKKAAEYLTIKEFGIKVPVNDTLKGLKYEVSPGDDSYVTLATDQFVQAVGDCKSADTASASFPAVGVISKSSGKFDANTPPKDAYSQFTKQFPGFYISYSTPDGGPSAFCNGSDQAKNNAVADLFKKLSPAIKDAVNNAEQL